MSESIEPLASAVSLPRLRIHHILVVTTVFATVMSINLGIWRLVFSDRQVEMPDIGSGLSILLLTQFLSNSVCISIVMFGIGWWRRGISFPSQPGHWAASYLTITWSFEVLQAVVFALLPSTGFGVMFAITLVFHCMAAVFCGVAFLFEESKIWKFCWLGMTVRSILSASWYLIYFGAKAVEWLLEVFWYNQQLDWQLYEALGSYVAFGGGILLSFPHFVALAFIPVAVYSDFRHDRQRHWSHWMAIISAFVSNAILVFGTFLA